MKATVKIENGETDIILKPENPFEVNLLKIMTENSNNFSFHTKTDRDYDYGNYKNERIIINIKEINQWTSTN